MGTPGGDRDGMGTPKGDKDPQKGTGMRWEPQEGTGMGWGPQKGDRAPPVLGQRIHPVELQALGGQLGAEAHMARRDIHCDGVAPKEHLH